MDNGCFLWDGPGIFFVLFVFFVCLSIYGIYACFLVTNPIDFIQPGLCFSWATVKLIRCGTH